MDSNSKLLSNRSLLRPLEYAFLPQIHAQWRENNETVNRVLGSARKTGSPQSGTALDDLESFTISQPTLQDYDRIK